MTEDQARRLRRITLQELGGLGVITIGLVGGGLLMARSPSGPIFFFGCGFLGAAIMLLVPWCPVCDNYFLRAGLMDKGGPRLSCAHCRSSWWPRFDGPRELPVWWQPDTDGYRRYKARIGAARWTLEPVPGKPPEYGHGWEPRWGAAREGREAEPVPAPPLLLRISGSPVLEIQEWPPRWTTGPKPSRLRASNVPLGIAATLSGGLCIIALLATIVRNSQVPAVAFAVALSLLGLNYWATRTLIARGAPRARARLGLTWVLVAAAAAVVVVLAVSYVGGRFG